jgi:hypothetical protein
MRVMAMMLAVVAGLAAVGCGAGSSSAPVAKTAATEKSAHGGWWCDEHGIPEAECSMCSGKVEKACKAKGDWCDQHARAKSQCFKCDPSLKEKFAAKYRAKYGTEPPPVEE